jgi:hypothetical protein
VLSAPLTREGAAQAAREELSKRIYQQAKPSDLQRAWNAVVRWLRDAWHQITTATPGGALGFLFILVVLAAVVVLLVRRRGASGRVRRGTDTGLETPSELTSSDLRKQADAYAARGDWAEAVRARLRAVVRLLEERGFLDPRPGRTAAEVAADAGAERPDLSQLLWAGALTFGEIWYGRRPATAADHDVLLQLDRAAGRRTRTGGAAPADNPAAFTAAPR